MVQDTARLDPASAGTGTIDGRPSDGERLGKLARLACDPNSPDGERASARRAFIRLADRSGLLQEDAAMPSAPPARHGSPARLSADEERAQFEAIWPSPPTRQPRRAERRRPNQARTGEATHAAPTLLFQPDTDRLVTRVIIATSGLIAAAVLAARFNMFG